MRKKSILYRAKLDGARRPEGHVLRYARMGIPYRAQPDGARPPGGHVLRDARMGILYRAQLDEARPCAALTYGIPEKIYSVSFL